MRRPPVTPAIMRGLEFLQQLTALVHMGSLDNQPSLKNDVMKANGYLLTISKWYRSKHPDFKEGKAYEFDLPRDFSGS